MTLYFCYLYRDAGNNKVRGEVLLENRRNKGISDLHAEIKALLGEDRWFDPESIGVPRLDFGSYDPQLDHAWHEYEELVPARKDAAHASVGDIVDLVEDLKETSANELTILNCR